MATAHHSAGADARLSNNETLSRRHLLSGAAGLPLLSSPASSKGSDPVLAEIAECHRLRTEARALPLTDDDAEFDRLCALAEAKLEVLKDMPPQSVRGAAAYLELFHECEGPFIDELSPLSVAIATTIAVLRGVA